MKYIVFVLLVGILLFFITRSIISIVKDVKRIKGKKKDKEIKDSEHLN